MILRFLQREKVYVEAAPVLEHVPAAMHSIALSIIYNVVQNQELTRTYLVFGICASGKVIRPP